MRKATAIILILTQVFIFPSSGWAGFEKKAFYKEPRLMPKFNLNKQRVPVSYVNNPELKYHDRYRAGTAYSPNKFSKNQPTPVGTPMPQLTSNLNKQRVPVSYVNNPELKYHDRYSYNRVGSATPPPIIQEPVEQSRHRGGKGYQGTDTHLSTSSTSSEPGWNFLAPQGNLGNQLKADLATIFSHSDVSSRFVASVDLVTLGGASNYIRANVEANAEGQGMFSKKRLGAATRLGLTVVAIPGLGGAGLAYALPAVGVGTAPALSTWVLPAISEAGWAATDVLVRVIPNQAGRILARLISLEAAQKLINNPTVQSGWGKLTGFAQIPAVQRGGQQVLAVLGAYGQAQLARQTGLTPGDQIQALAGAIPALTMISQNAKTGYTLGYKNPVSAIAQQIAGSKFYVPQENAELIFKSFAEQGGFNNSHLVQLGGKSIGAGVIFEYNGESFAIKGLIPIRAPTYITNVQAGEALLAQEGLANNMAPTTFIRSGGRVFGIQRYVDGLTFFSTSTEAGRGAVNLLARQGLAIGDPRYNIIFSSRGPIVIDLEDIYRLFNK